MNHMFYPEDESLQSFIFRQLSNAGVADFASVIDGNGRWLLEPRVAREHQSIFSKLEERELLAVTRWSGLAQRPVCLFENPVSPIHRLTRIFNSTYKSKGTEQGLQIAFCKVCIEKSIEEYGFGYFKSHWLLQSNCPLHSQRLYILPLGTRAGAVKALRTIFQGKIPKPILTVRKWVDQQVYSQLDFRERDAKNTRPHYMPCVILGLICFVRKNLDRIHENRNLKKRYWLRNFGLKEGTFVNTEDFEKICIELNRYEPELFNDFLENSLEQKTIRYGVWDSNCFVEPILKLRSRNCSMCTDFSPSQVCPCNR